MYICVGEIDCEYFCLIRAPFFILKLQAFCEFLLIGFLFSNFGRVYLVMK
jgi:hypothetical protein